MLIVLYSSINNNTYVSLYAFKTSQVQFVNKLDMDGDVDERKEKERKAMEWHLHEHPADTDAHAYELAHPEHDGDAEIDDTDIPVDGVDLETNESNESAVRASVYDSEVEDTDIQADETDTEPDNADIENDSDIKTNGTDTESDEIDAEVDDAEFETDETDFESDDTDIETDETDIETNDTDIETDHTDIETDDTDIEPDDTDIETDGIGTETDNSDNKTGNTSADVDNTGTETDDDDTETDNTDTETNDTNIETDDISIKTSDVDNETDKTENVTKGAQLSETDDTEIDFDDAKNKPENFDIEGDHIVVNNNNAQTDNNNDAEINKGITKQHSDAESDRRKVSAGKTDMMINVTMTSDSTTKGAMYQNKYEVIETRTRKQDKSAMKFITENGYRSRLEQYKRKKPKHPEPQAFVHIRNVRKVESNQPLKIDIRRRLINKDNIQFLIDIRNNTTGGVVYGCNFAGKMYYYKHGGQYISLCNTNDLFNGTYEMFCPNPGVSCIRLHLLLLFCNYEAYNYQPRYVPRNEMIMNQTLCFGSSNVFTKAHLVSWSLDSDELCDELFIDNVKQINFKRNQICKCVKLYDDIYIIGTSHIAIFGDYLMRTCTGLDLSDLKAGLKHGSLSSGNVHFIEGRYINYIYADVSQNLTTWLKGKSRVAIWLQTGSWDITYESYDFAMLVAMEWFKKLLTYIDSAVSQSDTIVDFHVLASPPMPSGHHWNNVAISAFNAKLQRKAEILDTNFLMNAFAVIEPCNEDYVRIGENHNHYMQSIGNTFMGSVGKAFYFGVFLPQVCPRV